MMLSASLSSSSALLASASSLNSRRRSTFVVSATKNTAARRNNNNTIISTKQRRGRRGDLVVRNGLFGLGLPEIVVIGGVTALLFGPSKLPELGKSLGKTVKSFQSAANEFNEELKTELEAVRVVRDKTTRTGKGIAFVLFKSVKAARTALLLDGFEMGKRELRVTKVGVVAPKRGNEVTKSRERVGKGNAKSKSGSGSENNANKRKANSWEGGRSAKGNKVAKFEKKSSVTGDRKRGGANVGSSKGKKGTPAKTTTKKKNKEPRASGKKRPAVALRKAKMKAGL